MIEHEELMETLRWPVVEWRVVDVGESKIRIRGVALKGNVVSKNNRHYLAKELKKATNTFIGKPITVNHDDKKKIGHLTWMDYDELTELLNYEGEVNKQPYVDMLRNKSAEVKGVSIQANYLFNKCSKCGEKFYSEEDYQRHMTNVEFVRNNFYSCNPHGLIGEAISLVLSPEIPGFEGSTVELAEMMRLQTLRLSEMIINQGIEEEKYFMTKKLEKETKEPALKPKPEPEPEKTAAETVLPYKITEKVPKAGSSKESETATIVLPEADIELKQNTDSKPEPSVNVKQMFALPTFEVAGLNVAESVTIKASEIQPFKASESTRLKLGEPFAAYTDFEDCVSKNQDKENPEAYCGSIKKDTEDKINTSTNLKQLTDKVNEVITEVNKPIIVSKDDTSWVKQLQQTREALTDSLTDLQSKMPSDDVSWKEQIRKVNDDLVSMVQNLNKIVSEIPADDVSWKDELTKTDAKVNADLTEVNGELTKVNGELTKLTDEQTKLTDEQTKVTDELTKLNAEQTKLTDEQTKVNVELTKLTDELTKVNDEQTKDDLSLDTKIGEAEKKIASLQGYIDDKLAEYRKEHDLYKESFSKTLATADKNVLSFKAENDKLKESVEELRKEKNKLNETLSARVDNVENKLKPEFKAKTGLRTQDNTVDDGKLPYMK